MSGYLLRRLLQAPLVLLALVCLSFLLTRLTPGNPFVRSERALDPTVLAALEARYGLDQPIPVQLARYLGGLLQGDLGPSITRPHQDVAEIIATFLPPSLYLGTIAILLALAVGVTGGVVAAMRRNGAFDYCTTVGAMLALALPTFVVGPLLILVFELHLGWVRPGSAGGYLSGWYVIFPALTLALPFAARIARLSRAGMLEVAHQDFVRTARAKGLSEHVVVLRHLLRGGLVPVLAFLGPAVAAVLTGSLVVERIFGIPGLGTDFVEAALQRDHFVVMGTVIVYGAFLIALNLVSDIVHGLVDPRVRLR